MSSLLITSHHQVRRIDIFLLQFATFSNNHHWSVFDPFELAAALSIAEVALQLELLLGTHDKSEAPNPLPRDSARLV